jgi:hypothetical protein
MNSDLTKGIVHILRPDGTTAGTGFVAHEDGLIATCAHAVQYASSGPRDTVQVAFYSTNEEREALVARAWWRDPKRIAWSTVCNTAPVCFTVLSSFD